MSKEMREQIDRIKNWKQFLNENKLNEGIEINKDYVNNFLNDFGFLITLNLSQVTKMGIDSNLS